jgi:acetylglutamate/LysW-gamma-L-alpha-aminoadipate kinase
MLIIKVGGSKNLNWDKIGPNIAKIAKSRDVILVHGASEIRDEIASNMDHPTEEIVSPSGVTSVFTDQESLKIFMMAYPGLVNKTIVAKLQSYGVNAVGLSGVDGKIWEGKWKSKVLEKKGDKVFMREGNLTGNVQKINSGLLETLLQNGYMPVLCPPAISFDNQIINTDNDMAIATMTEFLDVDELVSLFAAKGLMKDLEDETSLIKEVKLSEIEDYYKYTKGTMKKKIMGAKRCLENGVRKIYWGDARNNEPVSKAMDGEGTVLFKDT